MIDKNCQEFLLKLAKEAIVSYMESGKESELRRTIPQELLTPRGSFVTLNVKGELHGCIGRLETEELLYKDIISNATGAAFFDYRFSPLTKSDLEDLTIEISLLTTPVKLELTDREEILRYLGERKPGVILKNGVYQSTFLPQVWEEIPQAETFLKHLSAKAGMDVNAWQYSEIYTYQAEVIPSS
jgi:AmmeMemoRadiSam system protein A